MKTKHIHRDIPLFVSFAGSVIILLLLVAACDNKDYSKASPFDNAVYIDAAKVKDVANFTFNNLSFLLCWHTLPNKTLMLIFR